MKQMKFFALTCAISILFANCAAMVCSAETVTTETETAVVTSMTTTTTTSDDVIAATGLISLYSLAITASTKTVKITALTYGTETMAKIGFKNIQVQRSANGTSGWTTEFSLSDDLASTAASHNKNSEAHTVTGGYYYRVVLDHYAKETGWFFPSTQSITNYSNVVWIAAS